MADCLQKVLYRLPAVSSPESDRQVAPPDGTWLMAPFSLTTTDQSFEDSDKFHSPARGLQGLAYS